MSTTYIPVELRRLVRERATNRCEYCHIPESLTFYGCHVDHIVAEKHDGETTADNLAYACGFCNLNKGSDLGSLARSNRELVRFFNPRTDQWEEHFRWDEDRVSRFQKSAERSKRWSEHLLFNDDRFTNHGFSEPRKAVISGAIPSNLRILKAAQGNYNFSD